MAKKATEAKTPARQLDPSRGSHYLVMARRYRPQSFEQLVGQRQVSTALANAIRSDRVGHAYLFTGARGVGKTSTARILAKALDCVHGPTATPCNACDICQSITAGDDVDVLEIDGASNRGIDEIRQLRSNAGVRPSRARFKIYIIDEVHMLTPAAFNALLKTLEEPPEHVKFIFCTTDPEKIPITVLSRCQRFDFPPLESESIVERLRDIAATEGVEVDEAALRLLARRAGGSMRDSQSLLEQLLAFSDQRITEQQVHALLGTAPSGRLYALVGELAEHHAAAALTGVDEAVREGVDVGQLAEQLLGYFRDLMAVTVGCGPDTLLYSSASDLDALKQVSGRLGLTTILAIIQILDEAVTRMRQSTYVRTLLEMAIVRICHLEELDELAGVVRQLQGSTAPEASAGRAASSQPASASAASAAPSSSAAGAQKKSEVRAVDASTLPDVPVPSPPSTEPRVAAAGASGEPSVDQAQRWWLAALEALGDLTTDFAQHGRVRAIPAPNRLVVSFPAAYTLHKERCERPERKARIEQALAQLAGRRWQLEFTVESGPAQPSEASAPVPSSPRQRRRERENHPLVQHAMQLFDAEVLKVDEPSGP